MPRQLNTPIEFRIRALKVPRGVSGKSYLRTLLDSMSTPENPLPRGFQVELFWRNPEVSAGRSKNWQSNDFLSAVSDSNAGFASALRGVIQRKLYGGVQHEAPKKMMVRKKRKGVRKYEIKKRRTIKRVSRGIVRAPAPARKPRKPYRGADGRFKKRPKRK